VEKRNSKLQKQGFLLAKYGFFHLKIPNFPYLLYLLFLIV
jgi:hypothetical protein